jgi:AcrR family transcriptional regulator
MEGVGWVNNQLARFVRYRTSSEICAETQWQRPKHMGEVKTDRRVQKTRRALQEALISLILEKGYDAVMVQDILDRANVGRSTFYAHYQDKEDLLMNHFESLQQAFEEHARPVLDHQSARYGESDRRVNLPLFMLRYIESEHRLFKALLGKQGSGKHFSHFQTFMLNYTVTMIKNSAKAPLSPQQFEVVATYLSNSFLAMLVWWVDNDLLCSVEELYTLMLRLIEPGLKAVLAVETLWPSLT